MSEVLLDTLIDTLKLIPFLFLTYLLMEFIEHKTSEKTTKLIGKAGKFGPLLGGLIGVVPQCGFSASAASLYSGRIITVGTLIAVFISTSDEMLPVCISEHANARTVIEILLIKIIIAVIFGLAIDLILSISKHGKKEVKIHSLCEHDHCHCEDGSIINSAVIHSAQITLFIFIITLILNIIIHYIGSEALGNLFTDTPIVGSLIAGLVGLIPNCAASVVITELYLQGIINAGPMMAGLITGSGIGILVVFRTNKNIKENLCITLVLYAIGIIAGSIIEFAGISI